MVVQVLVVPHDLAGVGVQREGRVVVQVLQVGPADHELGRRRGDRGAHVDQVQLGVVARDHPRTHVLTLLEGNGAPALVAGLAGAGDEPPAPQLLARHGVVGHDDAGVGAALRRAAPARHHLAVGDDGARGLVGGMHPVVEDLGLPHQLAGLRVEGEDVVVAARVDDQLAPDRDVAVGVGEAADHVLGEVVGPVAAVFPDQVAGHRVEGLDDVARVRHVHHPVVDHRGPLLQPRPQGPRPHHADVAHVAAVDLVEGAVAQGVEGAPPHQPVVGVRVLQHGVGDGNEVVRGLGVDGGRQPERRQQTEDDEERRDEAACVHDCSLGN